MKALDLDFLTEYIGHEIGRLTKVVKNDTRNLDIAVAELEVANKYDVPQLRKKSQIKVDEAVQKLVVIQPRLEKLHEQYEILAGKPYRIEKKETYDNEVARLARINTEGTKEEQEATLNGYGILNN